MIAPGPAALLDLRAHACPITWVKTRIALSRLSEGEVLEVVLLDGEPRENVPRSAEEDGHSLLGVEPAPDLGAGTWRAWIRRGAPREESPWP